MDRVGKLCVRFDVSRFKSHPAVLVLSFHSLISCICLWGIKSSTLVVFIVFGTFAWHFVFYKLTNMITTPKKMSYKSEENPNLSTDANLFVILAKTHFKWSKVSTTSCLPRCWFPIIPSGFWQFSLVLFVQCFHAIFNWLLEVGFQVPLCHFD